MSLMDEFKLIELCESHPAIWDSNSVLFRDKDRKLGAWKEIACQLGCTVDNAQVTWKRLRDRYTRNKRHAPSDPQAERKKWDKEDLLKFLDKILVPRTATYKRSYGKFAELSTEDEAESSNQANVAFEHIEMENLSSDDSVDIETTKPTIKIQKHETDIPLETPALPIVAPSASTLSPTIVNEKPSKCKRSKMMDDQESIDNLAMALLSAVKKVARNMESNSQPPMTRNITESFIKLCSDQMYRLFDNRSETVQRQLRNRFLVFMDDLFEEFEL